MIVDEWLVGVEVRAVLFRIFAGQQVKVDELLDKAGRLLEPVGITRSDLETVLDRKLGLNQGTNESVS